MFIEENKSRDICLANCEAWTVIVTYKSGGSRFRYDGTTSSQNGDQFCPVRIATNSMTNIIASDSLQVHMIHKNGLVIRFSNTTCSNPKLSTLDEGDNLYIADTHGNVKMV